MRLLLTLLGALPLLLLPKQAHAQDASALAALPPVSAYMERVVERVNQGFELARRAPSSTASDMMRLFSIDRIASTLFATVDTDLRLTEEAEDLLKASPCLHIDIVILESLMEKTREEMNAAVARGAFDSVYILRGIPTYLQGRMKALLLGARDPNYRDREESVTTYPFDPPPFFCCRGTEGESLGICEERAEPLTCHQAGGRTVYRASGCRALGCSDPSTLTDEEVGAASARECPFDTDYFPPTSDGYGCDVSVLSRYEGSGLRSVREEFTALQDLVADRDAFLDQMAFLGPLTATIHRDMRLPYDPNPNFGLGASSRRTHRRITGCTEEAALPTTLAIIELRSPFSLKRDHVSLLTRLAALWRSWGRDRTASDDLKTSAELPPGADRDRAWEAEKSLFGWFHYVVREDARRFIRDFSVLQAQRESAMHAKIADSPGQMEATLASLREEVGGLSRSVAGVDQGIRGFARNLAYFLRSSCIYRPCNAQLERVLKLLFQDACFPYASGLYRRNPNIHEECRN